jgi:hypothetical protein
MNQNWKITQILQQKSQYYWIFNQLFGVPLKSPLRPEKPSSNPIKNPNVTHRP